MLTAEAHVNTPSARRYLAQLCRHFSNLRRHESRQAAAHAYARRDVQAHVEWSETHGMVTVNWGRCAMEANPDALTLRAVAADEESLRRVQDLLGEHVERFGKRDQLNMIWQRR